MSATAPWSVKGIDPKAREIAKDLARRSGMTLGEWLNAIIIDAPDVEGTPAASRNAAADQHRAEGLNALVSELGERLEEAERRSASAIEGIDQAVAGLMRRMDTARDTDTQRERRLDDIARDLRDGHQRLKTLETASPVATGEDLKLRLERAEDATRVAIQGLERSFAALDQRFGLLEGGNGAEAHQLTQLAENLGRQIEANRQDMLRRLAAVGDASRLTRVEQTLDKLVRQSAAAEQKSARAVEAMGHEIMRIAQNMNGRMQDVELATGGASLDQRLTELGRVLDEKLDREIARHAQTIDSRLTRQEDQNALALERLGGEITRISDRLSERITQTERRSSQAIDDISRRLTESSEKAERRTEDASGEMAERIRQSEERTRRLLDEAREVRARREAVAVNTSQRLTGHTPPEPTGFDDVPDFLSEGEAVSLFGTAPVDEWLPQQAAVGDWRASALSQKQALDALADSEKATTGWDDEVAAGLAVEPFAATEDLRPFGSLEDDLVEDSLSQAEPDTEVDDFPSIFASSEHEALAVRHARDGDDLDDSSVLAEPDVLIFNDVEPLVDVEDGQDAEARVNAFFDPLAPADDGEPQPLTTRDVIDHARAAIAEEETEIQPRKTFGLGKLRKKGGTSALQQKLDRKAARDGSTFGQALKVSALAMLVVGGGGYGTLKLLKDQDVPLDFGQPPAKPKTTAPLAALALDVTPTDAVPSKDVAATEGAAIFTRAASLLDNGDPSGLEPMRRAAELGYVPAQMRLAGLYADGGPGIEADAFEAREWVRRAAESGEPKAMQHYALQLYDGTGGTRDEKSALYWMRKSAEAGRVDSQYNVARLYEKGVKGAPANKVEAFTWYMIAARRGDEQARQAVQRLTPELADSQRRLALGAADNFAAQPAS